MEDSHIAYPTVREDNIAVFGVFDGHGGNKVVIKPDTSKSLS